VILYVSTQQPSGVPAQDGLHAMIRGGLEAMTADQAEHWADLGIRVHAIVPGLPQFEPSAAGDWHALAGGQAQAPVRRREADRIAALALSLCSTRAEALSGITHSAVG
jgi:NAD(P)-dependent dehydrogenase (short-subunit alcohol dehydrogenase family)